MHSIYNLKYSVPKKIPIVFHNESNYGYHFIIKWLAEDFKKQFTCLEKITRISKNREEVTKNISFILQFIDSARFMASSLLNLVDNLSAGIHRIKCKFGGIHRINSV